MEILTGFHLEKLGEAAGNPFKAAEQSYKQGYELSPALSPKHHEPLIATCLPSSTWRLLRSAFWVMTCFLATSLYLDPVKLQNAAISSYQVPQALKEPGGLRHRNLWGPRRSKTPHHGQGSELSCTCRELEKQTKVRAARLWKGGD